jgi:hypothetical protein
MCGSGSRSDFDNPNRFCKSELVPPVTARTGRLTGEQWGNGICFPPRPYASRNIWGQGVTRSAWRGQGQSADVAHGRVWKGREV